MERIIEEQRAEASRQIADWERHIRTLEDEKAWWISQRDFLHNVPGLSMERIGQANAQIHTRCLTITRLRELIALQRDRLEFSI